jgi:hypothetical protein
LPMHEPQCHFRVAAWLRRKNASDWNKRMCDVQIPTQ